MSEDLRYYFFDHEADGEPPIPADEGWKQMQRLLDDTLPLPAKRTKRRFYYLIGMATGVLLLLATLPFINYHEKTITIAAQDTKKNIPQNNPAAAGQQAVPPADAITTGEVIAGTTPAKTRDRNSQTLSQLMASASATEETPALNDPPITILPESSNNEVPAGNSDTKHNTPLLPSGKKHEDVTEQAGAGKEVPASTVTASAKRKNTAGKPTKKWRLDAGVGTNFSLQNTGKGLQPYPFVTVQHQLSARFFTAASLSVFSTVGSTASGVKRTVYLNDTFNNVSRYNEKLNYTRLSYADLSLSAGLKITNKLSVQAGVQASQLLNTATTTSLDPYDFNSNELMVQDLPSRLNPTPSAAPVYTNKVAVRKFDMRYLAGINYDLKKISLGLQYQGGIRPVLTGDDVSNTKTSLLSLKVAYRFK